MGSYVPTENYLNNLLTYSQWENQVSVLDR